MMHIHSRVLRLRCSRSYAQHERGGPFALSPSTTFRTGYAERSRRAILMASNQLETVLISSLLEPRHHLAVARCFPYERDRHANADFFRQRVNQVAHHARMAAFREIDNHNVVGRYCRHRWMRRMIDDSETEHDTRFRCAYPF